MHTTLRKIRKHGPCAPGWEKLLAYLGKTKADDEPLPLLTVLKSNGFDDTLWALRTVDGFESEIMWLAVEFARQVQHLMTDPRSITALDVAEKFLRGKATSEELRLAYGDASAAACDAARAADAAYVVACDVACNAHDAAYDAACDAARAARAAYAVACDVTNFAALSRVNIYAADAAADAAANAANAADAAAYAATASRVNIRSAQEAGLRKLIALEK